MYFVGLSVCFETDLFVLVVSKWVRNIETNRNKPKKFIIGFAKQTENEPKQIEFRFVSVRNEKKNLFVSRTPYLLYIITHGMMTNIFMVRKRVEARLKKS
jgi:hypothetical protein